MYKLEPPEGSRVTATCPPTPTQAVLTPGETLQPVHSLPFCEVCYLHDLGEELLELVPAL